MSDKKYEDPDCVWKLSNYWLISPILAFDTILYVTILTCTFKDQLFPKLMGKAKIMIMLTVFFMFFQLGFAIEIFIN